MHIKLLRNMLLVFVLTRFVLGAGTELLREADKLQSREC